MLDGLRRWVGRRDAARGSAVSAGKWRARRRAEAPAAGGPGTTVELLEAVLFRHDPMGIAFEDNTDEYRPEAEAIALRRDEVRSVRDAQRVTHEEFVRWFGADTAGRPDYYAEIAGEIWHLWRSDSGERHQPSSGSAAPSRAESKERGVMRSLLQIVRGVKVPTEPTVAVLLPQPLRSEVVRLRDGGAEVEAARRVREETGIGLLPAVLAVRAARERLTDDA